MSGYLHALLARARGEATALRPVVLPVFTPTAPGYSHSSGFRFSRWRAGPDGAGTSQNLVRTMAVNSGLA